MIPRLWIAVATLVGIYATAQSLKGRGMPTEEAHLQLRLEEMPRRLGTWTGEDQVLDPQVFEAIGAKQAIDRTYHDQRGNSLALHSAVFLEYQAQGLPHSPEICYPAAGFHIADSKVVYLDSAEKSAHPARLLSLERADQQTYCLFWYQFGDATYCDGYAQRRLILGFRGRKSWPPIVKVMLTTTATSPEIAARQLMDLAQPIFAWTKDFH